MDNKWLRLALLSFIGIIVGAFALRLLGNFSGAGAMVVDPSVMMGPMPYGMNMSGMMPGTTMPGITMSGMTMGANMASPMMPVNLADMQRQIVEMKTMMSIGLPTAVALGFINLWRSFR